MRPCGAVSMLVLLCLVVVPLAAYSEEASPKPAEGTKEFELAKFDKPEDYIVKPGPGGTDWDSQYRSMIQTSESAVSKGYPSHADAIAQIEADAAKSRDALQMHKRYVLFIKHFTQAYRPEEATAALKKLYYDLVAMEFGEKAEAGPEAKKLPLEDYPGLKIYRDVVYGKVDPKLQRLDAYILVSDKPTPVLMEFHGGGWRRGVKSDFEGGYGMDFIKKILAGGISIVSADYRLTPESQFPAQEEDAARAVQFVRSKAKEWNIDPTRIAAIGGSAGAHLSAWIGLHDDMADPKSDDPVARESTRLTCFVDFSGPMDLTRVRPTVLSKGPLRGEDFANAFTQAFGATYESYETDPTIRERVRAASPIFYVTPDDPPAFIRHAGPAGWSTKDHPPVPEMINDPHSYLHGALLADAMEAAGIKVVRDIGPDVGKDKARDADTVVAFLKENLKAK